MLDIHTLPRPKKVIQIQYNIAGMPLCC